MLIENNIHKDFKVGLSCYNFSNINEESFCLT